MRTGIAAAIVLLLLLIAFVPRSRDGRTPVPPPVEPDRPSPVASPVVPPDGPDGTPVASGNLRFRFVTRDGENAPPVPGVVVTLHRRTSRGWVEFGRIPADEDGKVEIGELTGTPFSRVPTEGMAEAEGRASVSLPLLLAAFLREESVVVLPPARPLAGRVLDAMTGHPVAGAQVETRSISGMVSRHSHSLLPGPLLARAETDADGTFRLTPRGQLLQVTAAGYATVRKSMRMSEEPVTIHLSPGAALEGRITDMHGRPVAGAKVLASPTWASTHQERWPTQWRLRDGRGWPYSGLPGTPCDLFTADRATSDADGRYRIPGVAAREEYFAWVLVDGRPRSRLTPVRANGAPCDFRLLRTASLTVRLARPDRKGVSLRLEPKGGPGLDYRARSEAGEVVRIDGVVPGIYVVTVVPERYRNRSFEVTLAPGADAIIEVPAREQKFPRLPESVTLTGVVVDGRGVPLANAWVSCEGGDELDKLTDAAGGFWFRLPKDCYPDLAAEEDGYLPARAHGWEFDGTEPIRFVLHRATRVRIPLRWGGAAPESVGVRSVFPGGFTDRRCEVEEGRIEPQVRADTTTVRLDPKGYLPVELPMPCGDAEVREVAPVTLDPGLAIRFRVVDRDGRGIPDAKVDVRQRDGAHARTATTDAGGRAVVRALFPDEPARATVLGRWHARGVREGLAAGGPEVVVVRLAGMVELSGRVVYDDGHPAGAVRITAARLVEGRAIADEGPVYSDNAGRFRIRLAPGGYRIALTPPTGRRTPAETRVPVVVKPDQEQLPTFEIPR